MVKKSFTVYCAEKYDKDGRGNKYISIDVDAMSQEDFEKYKAKCKLEQKKINRIYRQSHPVYRGRINRRSMKKINSNNESQGSQGYYSKSTNNNIIFHDDSDEEYEDNEMSSNVSKAINAIKQKPCKIRLTPKTGNTIAILGSSKAGKSHLMMHIYRKYFKNKTNSTNSTNKEGSKGSSSSKFITTLFSLNKQIDLYKDPDLLVCGVMNKASTRYINTLKYINTKGKKKNKYNFLIMFDDIINVRYNNTINNLVLTLRNSNVSTIICMQYSNLLSKMSRANFNLVILFRFNTAEAIEVVIKSFLLDYLNQLGLYRLDDQINFYRKVTSKYGFIIVDTLRNSVRFCKAIDINKL